MSACFLAPGPEQHGVVRHATRLAAASRTPLVRTVAELPAGAVVHLDLTDRLLAPDSALAEQQGARLFDELDARRALVVLGLHDIPDGSGSAWSTRRQRVYRRLAERAARVVACTQVEAELLAGLEVDCDAVLPLPVPSARRASPAGSVDGVTVLGFVWPGRGQDEVLAALPDGLTLTCVGAAAAGHEPLAAALAADPRVRVTGYLSPAEVEPYLGAATIPVAPNRALAASASICDWWARGRRPLVPDTRLTRELLRRHPGSLLPYDDLCAALAAARRDPGSTYLPSDVRPGPDVGAAAADRLAVGRAVHA